MLFHNRRFIAELMSLERALDLEQRFLLQLEKYKPSKGGPSSPTDFSKSYVDLLKDGMLSRIVDIQAREMRSIGQGFYTMLQKDK